MAFTNICKDPLDHNKWHGRGGGNIFEIYKTNSSFGNYEARPQLGDVQTRNTVIYTFTLRQMDDVLRGMK